MGQQSLMKLFQYCHPESVSNFCPFRMSMVEKGPSYIFWGGGSAHFSCYLCPWIDVSCTRTTLLCICLSTGSSINYCICRFSNIIRSVQLDAVVKRRKGAHLRLWTSIKERVLCEVTGDEADAEYLITVHNLVRTDTRTEQYIESY
jgi:hypothetical protein